MEVFFTGNASIKMNLTISFSSYDFVSLVPGFLAARWDLDPLVQMHAIKGYIFMS